MNTMMSKAFRAHGQMCASRPWEVIIGTITLTVCVMSMSFFATTKVCDWNYKCLVDEDTKSSDVIILSITKCIAIMYVYLQFRNLRKLGSQYLLGIAGVFTIFSSFVFSVAVINLVGSDLTGLNEALPFFLLLVDLAKACMLARFALSARTQEEAIENIGQGMAILGPTVTLDTLVEVLVIGVGTISGIRQLETMCCFGCLSVVANYLAFMTFYPACLALIVELTRGRSESSAFTQLQQLATIALKEEEEQKPNPVTQRVKIIMSAGLVLVHAHSRLLATEAPDTYAELALGDSGGVNDMSHYINPSTPLWKFYTYKALTPTIDYIVTVGLGVILALKYIFFDGEIDVEQELLKKESLAKKKDLEPSSGFQQMDWFRDRAQTMPVSARPRLADLIEMVEVDQLVDTGEASPSSVDKHLPPEEAELDSDRRPRLDSTASFTVGDSDSEGEGDAAPRNVNGVTVETQTDMVADSGNCYGPLRSLEHCIAVMKSDEGPAVLSDQEVMQLVNSKQLPAYKLEAILGDHERGVAIRRNMVSETLLDKGSLNTLPYANYDYSYVEGACCENVVGYMPVPVGVAGPLLLDGVKYQVPMATTEGCLVASTNRGCRALGAAGGANSSVIGNGMTRAPVVRFVSACRASLAKRWLDDPDGFDLMADSFNSTSRFARLKRLQVVQAARNLYVRFVAVTGDAMGMNMISKGAEKALGTMQEHFPDMEVMSLSGNFCSDKKHAAVNWLEGRGKSVVCEAVIPAHIVKTVLKTSVPALVDLNISKNLMGSAMAGSIGGFNAHAANVVAAIYIATGQDPAQCVCSSYCMTVMEAAGLTGDDLYISCTMPSIEVGTVGGGTMLPPQAACLQMLGVKGACKEEPGSNASKLATIVCGTVMAGELSLMSALAAGHLVRSHLKHNRSALNMAPGSGSPLPPTDGEARPTPPVGSCMQN